MSLNRMERCGMVPHDKLRLKMIYQRFKHAESVKNAFSDIFGARNSDIKE